jgi:hypothetical protein
MLWLRAPNYAISYLPAPHVGSTYHYPVIPREKSQFNQSSYKIVPCGDVAGNEDEDGHSRERVHPGSFYRNSRIQTSFISRSLNVCARSVAAGIPLRWLVAAMGLGEI